MRNFGRLSRIGAVSAGLVLCTGLLAPSAVADETTSPSSAPSAPEARRGEDKPDLRVGAELSVTGRELVDGERVKVKVTVANAGSGEARAVTGHSLGDSLVIDKGSWQALNPAGAGGTIAAGASVVVELDATVRWQPGNSTSAEVTVRTGRTCPG